MRDVRDVRILFLVFFHYSKSGVVIEERCAGGRRWPLPWCWRGTDGSYDFYPPESSLSGSLAALRPFDGLRVLSKVQAQAPFGSEAQGRRQGEIAQTGPLQVRRTSGQPDVQV